MCRLKNNVLNSRCSVAQVGILTIIVFFAFGCVHTPVGKSGLAPFTKASNEFGKGLVNTKNLFTNEIKQGNRVIRMNAIQYHLVNGPVNHNLDPTDIKKSFSRFVCYGQMVYVAEMEAIKSLESYGKFIADLSKAPVEDKKKLWKSIKDIRSKSSKVSDFKDMEYDEFRRQEVKKCMQNMSSMVPPHGESLSPNPDIPEILPFIATAIAGYEALKVFIEALDKVLVAGLQIADAQLRAKALQEFILNEDKAGKVREAFVVLTDIDKAFEARKRASLIVPFNQFEALLVVDHRNEKMKILKIGEGLIGNLEEFDTISRQNPPSEGLVALREAHGKLVELAQNPKLKFSDLFSEIKGFVKESEGLLQAGSKLQGFINKI